MRSIYRGHETESIDGEKWVYCDTKEPVPNNKNRACGVCGIENTEEGHDPCLGTLPLLMNACCGHGIVSRAYIQFWGGFCIRGRKARVLIKILKSAK